MNIDERTKIPLFTALSAVAFIVGGAMWLTIIYADVAEAKRINEKQDRQIQNQTEILTDIRDRIIRIEEHLKTRGNK